MRQYVYILIVFLSSISAQNSGNTQAKLKSLILPGWGEKELGKFEKANNFFVREGILWLILIGAKTSANWYESDYIAFAELYAGADMTGKDYLYAVNLGHYNSLESYNDLKERQRSVADKYIEGKGYEWQWDNLSNRIQYDNMRIKFATHSKYATFALGGLVLHRLVSFINVIYIERFNNINLSSKINYDLNSIEMFFSFNLDF